MARDEDPTRGKVKASVAPVIREVPREDTESRSGSEFVGCSGSGVRVTRTPKDPKVIVPRRGTEKSVVWCGSWVGSGRKSVEKIGGGVQTLSPEVSRERPEAKGCTWCRCWCESCAQPCRSERCTGKTCATGHRERGRKHERWSYRTHGHCHTGRP